MQQELLKKIILEYVGQGSEKLVDLLYGKKNVNEFQIAKKLELTINQARNMLYKLGDRGLVGFIRKKDKKRGGWYTYFWTLRVKNALLRFKEKVEKDIRNLRNQLNNRKVGRYFYCRNCEIEYNEENAMTNEYTCHECGEVLDMKDNSELVHNMKAEVEKLEGILVSLNEEIESIEAKEQRSKNRRLKAEQKKKEEERARRRKEREREKKREERKKAKEGAKARAARKKVKKKIKKKIKKKVKKWAKKKSARRWIKKKVVKKLKKKAPRKKLSKKKSFKKRRRR